MSRSSRFPALELRYKFADGSKLEERIESFEISEPSITTYEIETYGGSAHSLSEPAFRQTVIITGEIGLYEKVQRVVADCRASKKLYETPLIPPPSQRMLVPAAVLLLALLAIVLLAGGLG